LAVTALSETLVDFLGINIILLPNRNLGLGIILDSSF
jgi:hypothetical protein